MIRRAAYVILCMWLTAMTAPAHESTPDESVVSGLSQDRVQITSTYSGTDLVIFGAIEAPTYTKDPDIVVVVRGPSENMTVRRKARVAGIWLNTDKARFTGMPSYYHLAATCPLEQIAPPGTRRRYQIGFDALAPENHRIGGALEEYRAAMIRRLTATKMYTENPHGVDMLSHRLFRAHVRLPAAAPRGRYMVRVYYFRDGALVGYQVTPFFVDQIGLERRILQFSHTRPIAYGIFAILMAMLLGWLATVIPQLSRRQ